MKQDVGVVVLNYNAGVVTTICLKSLLGLKQPPAVVAVCDNDSDDDSWDVLTGWCRLATGSDPVLRPRPDCHGWGASCCLEYALPAGKTRIVLLRTARNLGFAGGNNVGLRYLLDQNSVRHLWLLNNDTEVEPDTLDHLLAALDAQPGSGMVCSTVRYRRAPGLVQAYGGGRYYPLLGSTTLNGNGCRYDASDAESRVHERRDFPLGASMLVRRRFVTEVGLLDEGFFLYFEELDWLLRARGRFSLAYAPRSIVWHREGASIGACQDKVGGKSLVGDFHFQRSRLLLSRKHYPRYYPLVVASLVVTLCKRILRGQVNRVPMLWRCIREASREPV